MEIRLINANHLKSRLMNESAVVQDTTLDAIRLVMNLRFDSLIDTEPTAEMDVDPADPDYFITEPDCTYMEVVTDEGLPRPVRCVKCRTMYAMNAEWLEDGAVALPNFCPHCGRPVGSVERGDGNGA